MRPTQPSLMQPPTGAGKNEPFSSWALYRYGGCRPPEAAGIAVRYVPDSMQNLRYDDGFFDRVFCLSVMEHIPDREWPECMRGLSRVLSAGGRLALTLSMSAANANVRQYEKLLVEPFLRLVGNVDYVVPIGAGDKQARHPGHTLEILGLIWDKK